jgi:hypothetical protein
MIGNLAVGEIILFTKVVSKKGIFESNYPMGIIMQFNFSVDGKLNGKIKAEGRKTYNYYKAIKREESKKSNYIFSPAILRGDLLCSLLNAVSTQL